MALGNNVKRRINKENKAIVENIPPVPASESEPAGKIDPVEGEIHSEGEKKNKEETESILKNINHQAGKTKEDGGSKTMLVVFPVGDEEYALTIDRVKEVVKTPPIAPIPQVPDYIKGVTNVRGNVVAIIDLAKKMGFSEKEETGKATYTMVINSDEYKIAISIDHVPDTLIIKDHEIDHSSNIMVQSSHNEDFIKGIVRRDQRMIIIIDILEMILNDEFSSN